MRILKTEVHHKVSFLLAFFLAIYRLALGEVHRESAQLHEKEIYEELAGFLQQLQANAQMLHQLKQWVLTPT